VPAVQADLSVMANLALNVQKEALYLEVFVNLVEMTKFLTPQKRRVKHVELANIQDFGFK
jgi:hypothetical protein